MKRKLIVSLVLLVFTAVLALPAFAETDPVTSAKSWFEERFAWKSARVDQAVEDGRISPEQGQALKEHFDEMYKWHEENGFTCPMGGPGQGMGFGRGGGHGWGNGQGFGRMGS